MDESDIWSRCGESQKIDGLILGPHTSYQYKYTPRHILFELSRYKFAHKLIGTDKQVLELGCGDGIGIPILSEYAKEVVGVDFDHEMIDYCKSVMANKKVSFIEDNFLDKTYGKFDSVVCMDVIEHTYKKNENTLLRTICKNLNMYGIAIVGTPNMEASKYSSGDVLKAHINLYSYERLKDLMEKYFNNVFIFSQNDEIIHTGYYPMAHYLIAIGVGKK